MKDDQRRKGGREKGSGRGEGKKREREGGRGAGRIHRLPRPIRLALNRKPRREIEDRDGDSVSRRSEGGARFAALSF